MPTPLKIKILPDLVANQIAAGEVVERPMSIVKELLENSLDAGATRIEVAFANGGKRYLRVGDNGVGMSHDDALLAIQRHATSKIYDANDLQSLQTFGFRGEALPSIASVAHFTLRTRTSADDCGTEIRILSGKLHSAEACAAPVGTTVEITHLFKNVPARLKFLKSDHTEAHHIEQCVRTYAVLYPQVAFSLYEDKKLLFTSPTCEYLHTRVGEIFGALTVENLENIHYERDGMRLFGLAERQPAHGASKKMSIVAVNGRPVEHRGIYMAILDAYKRTPSPAKFPIVFLFLELHPAAVDVNVHPTKREIRFRNEANVRRFITEALLHIHRLTPSSTPSQQRATFDSQRPYFAPQQRTFLNIETPRTGVNILEESPANACTLQTLHWRVIGLLKQRILVETPTGLLVVDVKAAQERIIYEKLLREKSYAQQLLVPVVLDLTSFESELLLKYLKSFERVGFCIREFGNRTFRIEAVPVYANDTQSWAYVRDILASLTENRKTTLSHEDFNAITSRCHGQHFEVKNNIEATELLHQLIQCGNPHITPAGKPITLELSHAEIDRRLSP